MRLTAGGGTRAGRTRWLRLLHQLGYSTQGNARMIGGKRHPDRDAQFRYISGAGGGVPCPRATRWASVDAKKKEQVGRYRAGRAGVAAERGSGPGPRS